MEKELKELHELVTGLREKLKASEEGRLTKSELLEFEARVTPRIDFLETAIRRPGLQVGGGKELKEGQAEYMAAFLKMLKTGKLELDTKAEKYILERKALVADATGEILIPEELESEIYRTLPKINVIRGLCTVRTTIRDRIRRRSLTEVTVSHGKLETGAVPAETTPVPAEAFVYVEDVNGLAKLGKDEMADSDVMLEATVMDSFSRALAEDEETMCVNGRGHASQEQEGILLGTTVTRVLTTAADAISAEDLLNLAYAVAKQYRKNGRYLVPSTTELAMRKLRASGDGTHFTGNFLWQPAVAAGAPATFAGFPVENQEDIPAIGASAGCDVAIFGDLKAGYAIIDRQGMTVQRLVELFATAGMIGILVNQRAGACVIRPDALRVLQETT